MRLALLGLSHHTAPVDLRERVDFGRTSVPEALVRLVQRPGIDQAVVLSTCNRTEMYVGAQDPEQAWQTLAGFLSDYHNVPLETLEPHLYTRSDEDVARHLFRVAAGLDSLVVGEPQILGQVKEAFTVASEHQRTGAILNKLFHTSFAVGKRVRSDTGLGEGAVSVSYAAVALAKKIFGQLTGLNVLLMGAGEMGKLTARHLHGQNVKQFVITSRTTAHAQELADQLGATVVPWSERNGVLARSDIVVTASGAAQAVVTRAQVEAAMRQRRNRPLFLIDIAMPRDVEAEAGDIDQVFLYNIDDLQSVVQENLARRTVQVHRAETIVSNEVMQFSKWMRSRVAIPTVVALREHFEAIRQSELKRLQPKLAELSPEARNRVDEITRLIVEKLLLTPTEQLKSLADRDTVLAYSDALSRLFSLAAEKADDEVHGAHTSGARNSSRDQAVRS